MSGHKFILEGINDSYPIFNLRDIELGKYLNTSDIKNITIETKHSNYKFERID